MKRQAAAIVVVLACIVVGAITAHLALGAGSSPAPEETADAGAGPRIVPAVVDDPQSDEYDPVVLMRAKGISAEQVFDAESRRDAWAQRYEGKLRTQIERDLAVSLPEGSLESLECRSSSCQVRVAAPADLLPNLMMAFPVPHLGSLGSLDPARMETRGEKIIAVYTLLFRPEHRDEEAYDRWYRSRRSAVLQGIGREGGLPNGKKLPTE